jgi:hypothetical protein
MFFYSYCAEHQWLFFKKNPVKLAVYLQCRGHRGEKLIFILDRVFCWMLIVVGCRVLVVACWMSLSVVVYRFVVVECRELDADCRCQCYNASGLGSKDYLMSKKKFRKEKSFLGCFTCS